MSKSGGVFANTIGRLRHPWLFGIAAVALVADLAIPDIIPFVDELLIAAATTALALLRKRRVENAALPEAAAAEATAPADSEDAVG